MNDKWTRQNWPLRKRATYKGRLLTVVGHESNDCPNFKPLVVKFDEPTTTDPTHLRPEDLEEAS